MGTRNPPRFDHWSEILSNEKLYSNILRTGAVASGGHGSSEMCSSLLRVSEICVATGLGTACADTNHASCAWPSMSGCTKSVWHFCALLSSLYGVHLCSTRCGRGKDSCPNVEMIQSSSVQIWSVWVGSWQSMSCQDIYTSKLCQAPTDCSLSSGSSVSGEVNTFCVPQEPLSVVCLGLSSYNYNICLGINLVVLIRHHFFFFFFNPHSSSVLFLEDGCSG